MKKISAVAVSACSVALLVASGSLAAATYGFLAQGTGSTQFGAESQAMNNAREECLNAGGSLVGRAEVINSRQEGSMQWWAAAHQFCDLPQ